MSLQIGRARMGQLLRHASRTNRSFVPVNSRRLGQGAMQPPATAGIHLSPTFRQDEDENEKNRRLYHTSPPSERAVAIILGLASLSALAYAGSSAVSSYNEWRAMQPSDEEVEKQRKEQEAARQKAEANKQEGSSSDKESSDGPRENVFKEWFGVGVGSKYYEGGFDDTMTKREAALILGVRESSPPQRIKDAHRKLLILNHPDTGGSTYLSGKINEAKELLLKGKARAGQ